MPFLIIFLLDHMLLASLIQDSHSSSYDLFPTIDDFLSSPLWKAHKHSPRIVYVETEISHRIINFGGLSMLEKFLFWIRKRFLTPYSKIIFLSYHQAMVFHLKVPQELKEGPLLKTTCLFLELFKLVPKQVKETPSLYYYSHPYLGVWNLATVKKRVFFHRFTPLVHDNLVKNHLETTRQYLHQRGIKEKISLFDLASSSTQKSRTPLLQIISLEHSFFLVPSNLQMLIAANLFLVFCFFYTIFSIHVWDKQLNLSHQALNEMQAKINTPHYQRLNHQFQQEKSAF